MIEKATDVRRDSSSFQCVFHLFPEFSAKRSLHPKTGNMGGDFSGGVKKQRRCFFFSHPVSPAPKRAPTPVLPLQKPIGPPRMDHRAVPLCLWMPAPEKIWPKGAPPVQRPNCFGSPSRDDHSMPIRLTQNVALGHVSVGSGYPR